MKDVIARLARACAHGYRQEQLVTELLTGPVRWDYESFGRDQWIIYGEARLVNASYRNLRKRLIEVGFIFSRDNQTRTVTMTFPEYKEQQE